MAIGKWIPFASSQAPAPVVVERPPIVSAADAKCFGLENGSRPFTVLAQNLEYHRQSVRGCLCVPVAEGTEGDSGFPPGSVFMGSVGATSTRARGGEGNCG